MTPSFRFLAATFLSLSTVTLGSVAAFGQQFGPSPQAMYKQHPGSAPTYVNYGEPTSTPQVGALSSTTHQPSAATQKTTTTAAHKRVVARSTSSAR